MGKFLTNEEFNDLFLSFDHTAFRLELQPSYKEAFEEAMVQRFLNGQPQSPDEIPAFRDWYAQIVALTDEGKRIERVRVFEDPPTDYQRWLQWVSRWNAEAGEHIRYMTRSRSHEVGLLPAAGDEDWWLFDSSRLLVMRFDEVGNRIENELITDPERVVQACAWRDLAVHHSTAAAGRGTPG